MVKFIHLSDLHIGKRVNEFSMLEDQEYILTEIINIIDTENPDAVIIAGDVYDKSLPSAEAVQLFDKFLYNLSTRNLKVFIISGNHDSAERLSFGSKLFSNSGIYISPVYNGKIDPINIEGVNIYMLPFIKPSNVRQYYSEEIESYTDALNVAISHMDINEKNTNVLVTHQFVTGATRSESEEISVGGSDNVDVSVFDKFDYVALGHIHGAQSISRETVRYCGTPLKYSFSEKDHKKSLTVVEISSKYSIELKTVPLVPLHDMREIRGTYDDLTLKSNYENTSTYDYLHIILTDEDDVPDALARLRTIYPNILKLDYDNVRTRYIGENITDNVIEYKTPYELFYSFFEKQNGVEISAEQKEFVDNIIEDVWGEVL